MKSSEILKKSEDCTIYWGFKCKYSRNPDKKPNLRSKNWIPNQMYNGDEWISKWINLFQKTNTKHETVIPLSNSWSQNWLVHRLERGYQVNNKDFMDFTIYRG